MGNQELFARFAGVAPFSVMTRMLTSAFIGAELDQVFEKFRESQYTGEAKFSAIALAVADVALNFSANFNQAYKSHRKELGIAVTSFYDKIKGTEIPVSEGVVERSGEVAAELQDALEFAPWVIIPGYRVFGVDGMARQSGPTGEERCLLFPRQGPDGVEAAGALDETLEDAGHQDQRGPIVGSQS